MLAGVVVVLYAVAALFAGGSVASATRGVSHSRKYATVTIVVGLALIAIGIGMIAT